MRKIHKNFKLALALILGGIILGAIVKIGPEADSNDFLYVIAICMMVAGVLINSFMVQCPHCGDYLRVWWYKFCPHCGKALSVSKTDGKEKS